MCIEVSFHPPNVTVGCGSSLPSQLEHYKYVQYSELEYMFVYYLKVNIAAGGNFDKRFRSTVAEVFIVVQFDTLQVP
jgi:hypothetical protein